MNLTTDFECGSGTLTRAGVDTWRLDSVGDRFGYNRYFCLRIDNRGGEATELRLSIHPDPTLTDSHFMSHFPSDLWYCENDDWRRWVRLHNTWPGVVTFEDDRIELKLRVRADAVLHVATNPPMRCSDLDAWLDTLVGCDVGIEQIGQSVEGRAIRAVRFKGAGDGAPRLLVLAGMHASEHGGVWAARAIVEYLLSSLDRARVVTRSIDIAVVPMLNPDGNVHGFSGGSTQRLTVNNSLDFAVADADPSPVYHENQVLWRWLNSRFRPHASLHFHGYLGRRRFGDEPGDGVYAHGNIDAAYADPGHRQAYRAMLDRLRLDTDGFSAHWFTAGRFAPGMLEIALAQRFKTLGVLYEVNCGTVGIASQMRRGPQVLDAVTSALLRDVPPESWAGR